MTELLDNPYVNLAALGAVTAILVAGGIYVIGRVRAESQRKEPAASEWLTNFRELHAKGELSDEEFRTIKAMLSERLQHELKCNEETR